jgi:hypothetical protein
MMNKKTQAVIASCVLAGSVLVTGVILYLAVAFPRTVAVWADQGRELSAGEMLMANLSNLAKTSGLPLLALLMLSLVASLVWLVVSIRESGGDSANQQMQTIAAKRGSV